jgi:hypothetical protein
VIFQSHEFYTCSLGDISHKVQSQAEQKRLTAVEDLLTQHGLSFKDVDDITSMTQDARVLPAHPITHNGTPVSLATLKNQCNIQFAGQVELDPILAIIDTFATIWKQHGKSENSVLFDVGEGCSMDATFCMK